MLYKKLWLNLWVFAVTTFAVVWIEISFLPAHPRRVGVTTFAVVWIEIGNKKDIRKFGLSPPSRWCGLKYKDTLFQKNRTFVTTFAVVWIEISVW